MFESAELGRETDKADYKARVPALREELLDLQFQLRSAPFSCLVVVAGFEGAGKGETVNHLLEWLDSRGIETHALGPPSDEERQWPDFYRFWRRLPNHGRIAIFFGSWYARPLSEGAEAAQEGAGGDGIEAAARRIVDFERLLTDDGVLLLKYWLHVTKRQQKKAFEKLEREPETAWRVTAADWRQHERYDQHRSAAARLVERTDTGHAPWTLIEAHDRRHRELAVAEHLRERLAARLARPAPAPAEPAPPPAPTRPNVLSVLDLGSRLDEDEYKERKAAAQARIGPLARELTAARRSLVAVFEGSDAAGKGGCIRRLTRALDARFFRVWPISAPTDEERQRPYLWRFWRRLPRLGRVAIFDRSWYGRVLVERIEGYASPAEWRRAYAEINAFEEQLADGRALVSKFWLAISKAEQLERFEAREATGYKRYKITPDDWRNRDQWDAYEAAACEAIERTSTARAPWTLVPAEDKRFARVTVLETIADRLERALHDS